jgi:hypothetical protein
MSNAESSRLLIEQKLKEIIPTVVVSQEGGQAIATIKTKNATVKIPIFRSASVSNSTKLR